MSQQVKDELLPWQRQRHARPSPRVFTRRKGGLHSKPGKGKPTQHDHGLIYL